LILRMVRGRVLPGRHQALRAGLRATFSQVRDIPGLIQAHMALRSAAEETEFAVISTWTTPDATMAAFGPDVSRVAELPGITEHLEFRSVEHFELDESVLIQADQPSAIVRIAVGSVELGSDVEIQQELRRRVHELGDEVVEAFVGRRIREQMVEIAFVTLWSRRPADRSLEEPVFPDVADRYSSYWIEVYDEVYRG
jgi:heme-degrading monooxygenase HmoA